MIIQTERNKDCLPLKWQFWINSVLLSFFIHMILFDEGFVFNKTNYQVLEAVLVKLTIKNIQKIAFPRPTPYSYKP